jgi:UDP-3-O-[3-hydroxymyristoyl] N-acetylglucosamine deacetylase/UDP-3-O-[3-hydroxymyristoyl] N-acetylglucosamine deacetylase/3-hydroxyacyl-[acyl-carrier-protein] dehydratase
MTYRLQQTIRKPVEVSGIGFLTGADITLRFLPADPDQGIVFERTDCPDSTRIPARMEYTVPRRRRTAIEHRGVTVEMTEHVMAALAGLQIDNCVVQLNAPEPPGGDGSALLFVDALLKAGTVTQEAERSLLVVGRSLRCADAEGAAELEVRPLSRPTLAISYQLDYGPRSPIRPQNLTVEINPLTFLCELAFARTFVLEEEVESLRAQGYGARTTAKDLLVFGADGVIENELRAEDECARHKILDCLGDFALCGCDLHGHFSAFRSGHTLNREIIRQLQAVQTSSICSSRKNAA